MWYFRATAPLFSVGLCLDNLRWTQWGHTTLARRDQITRKHNSPPTDGSNQEETTYTAKKKTELKPGFSQRPKPSYFWACSEAVLYGKFHWGSVLCNTQASYARPKPSTEHAQWKFQSQAIKAASNQALPLTPNKTSPRTHRFCHFWNPLALVWPLGSQPLPILLWSLFEPAERN